MKLYYYQAPDGNFGDDLNPWLWNRLLPQHFDNDSNIQFIGIGTLLNHRITPAKHNLVFGTGAGYGTPLTHDASWKFFCVRGPLTAATLKLAPELAITDSAALVARQLAAPRTERKLISYMPHHGSLYNADWATLSHAANLNFIDPSAPVENVLHQINQSKLLITEAMHGAIVADALRVPWIPVKCYSHILDFKWHDWCQSLQLPYQPILLPEIWHAERHSDLKTRLKNKVKRSGIQIGLGANWTPPPPARSGPKQFDTLITQLAAVPHQAPTFLSQDSHFDRALSRLEEQLEHLRADQLLRKYREKTVDN